MFRKPVFWIVFVVVSIGCVLFTCRYFSEAFPIANLRLKMDRHQALQLAEELARKHGWGPEGYETAASFALDNEVQNFVELEGGGNDAFNNLLQEGLYYPYTWRVRHFKENETAETRIRFTPTGQPYGFAQKLPEDAPGAALTAEEAREIAEAAAVNDWAIDLTPYTLEEESEELRLAGRIDHSFVYERTDVQIGGGRYRLRLVVGGDALTELTHFVKVPEAFSRRYEAMRSDNDTIGIGALISAGLLYVLGGCIIGLFFLQRQRWVIWKKAVYWAAFIAFLQLLAGLNQFPLIWMNYDTALSSQGFLLQQLIQLLAGSIFMGVILALSLIGAESLSRKAFPHHVQHWRAWSPDVAGSPTILGYTVSGYLLVGVFLAFEVALYFFATRVFGWWTPSEAQFQPDLLAAYLPWLSSIAISAQAGFWEECLFRAIPIAGAALLGQKYGGRRAWVIAAFVVQALIFGAGHANYPQQPAYARVVELIIPSIGFGLLYIYLGLLPAIVLHYAVDVVFIGMPLFVSSASGIWIDQALVILLGLVPLWVVIRARVKAKRWLELKAEHYNRAWNPPAAPEPEPVEEDVAEPAAAGATTSRLLLTGGALGLIAWIFATDFQSDAPTLTQTRGEAKDRATELLSERGVALSEPWQTLSSVDTPLNQNDRFIWQEGGEEIYSDLLGTYLGSPGWTIRYAQFEGDVAERAEEYRVTLDGDGGLYRLQHKLPESRPGARLEEAAARAIADSVINTAFQLNTAQLKFISSEPSNLDARTDWKFTFADTVRYPMQQGEARIAVEIAGDEPVDAFRYVHVPEEWERMERNRRNVPNTLKIVCDVLIFILVLTGAISAIVSWSRKVFSPSTFLTFFILLFALRLIASLNSWPALIASFSTAEPYSNQMFIALAVSIVGTLFLASSFALLAGFVQSWKRQQSPIGLSSGIAQGVSIGLLVAGLIALLEQFSPSLSPTWANYIPAGTVIPLGFAFDQVDSYIFFTLICLLIFTAVDKFTGSWQKRKGLFSVLFVLVGMIFAGMSGIETVPSWLLSGLLAGILLLVVYRFVFRFHLALVPLATAASAICGELKEGLYLAYPGALGVALFGIILTGGLSLYWFKKLSVTNDA